ncbi:MAG: type II secretion system F family protein [Acidobacteriia bacterium]|nr:type II secretion system F family protein [Terriglobia bacterium]
MIILLFAVMLIVIFAVVMIVTRPTARERTVEKRLTEVASGAGTPSGHPEDLLKTTRDREIPLFDELFRRLSVTRNLNDLITQAQSQWTVSRLLGAMLVIFAAVFFLASWWLPFLLLRLALAALLALTPYAMLHLQRKRRFSRFEALLPDAMDLMTRGLRAGHSVSSAIQMVGEEIDAPVGPEFRQCFEQQNFGLPFREAIEALARRVPIPDLQFLLTAVLVQKESGGNLAEVLDKAGAVIRERIKLKGELAIYTAQGKLTGWILGLLPFVMFFLLTLINPRYTAILLEDPWGKKLVWTGLAMMAVGFYTIRKIVDIKV